MSRVHLKKSNRKKMFSPKKGVELRTFDGITVETLCFDTFLLFKISDKKTWHLKKFTAGVT